MDSYRLIAYFTGEATGPEREAVEAWRRANPNNERLFKRQEEIWGLYETLAVPARSETDAVSLERKTQVASPTMVGERAAATGVRERPWLLAASIFLAVTLGIFAARRSEAGPLLAARVSTGAGEIVTVELEDGTVVRLGPNSSLEAAARSGPRDVSLSGQAYFAVPEGQPHPFRVHTTVGGVTVVGTRFEVNSRDERLRLIVVEGEVIMETTGNRVQVAANQMTEAAPGLSPRVETLEDAYRVTAWVGDFTAYQATPLREIEREFAARFDLDIEIRDPELADRTVTGSFSDETPLEIFSSICQVIDAECSIEGERLLMSQP